MRKIDQIINDHSIAYLTMSIFYIYLSVTWFEFYWYGDNYLDEYLRLDVATYTLTDYEQWISSAIVYDFIIVTSPALLLWKKLFIRSIFYGCFFALYLFPSIPNPNLTVLGLVSQSLYTVVVAFVGFLLCSDILKTFRFDKSFLNFVNSRVYCILTYSTALLVVISSIFGKRPEREYFVQQYSENFSDIFSIVIGMPSVQIILFMACSLGIFSTGNSRVVLIILSWITLAVFVPIRLEWNMYFMLSDLYVLLSSVMLWSTKYHRQG